VSERRNGTYRAAEHTGRGETGDRTFAATRVLRVRIARNPSFADRRTARLSGRMRRAIENKATHGWIRKKSVLQIHITWLWEASFAGPTGCPSGSHVG